MIRTGVVASKSITSAICTLRPCIVHVGIYRPKSGIDFLRGQKHKCPKSGLQSTPSAMADSDVDEYQKRWEASWNAGLKPGEVSVWDSRLHHPLCSLCCGLDLKQCCTVRPPPLFRSILRTTEIRCMSIIACTTRPAEKGNRGCGGEEGLRAGLWQRVRPRDLHQGWRQGGHRPGACPFGSE